jgi:hypothetical protein
MTDAPPAALAVKRRSEGEPTSPKGKAKIDEPKIEEVDEGSPKPKSANPVKKTETKQLSLAKEAWEDYFHFRHEFPQGNFGAQILRYLKLKESLNSFNFKKDQKENTFFDTVGSDGYSRPYMNHFGAQSSRTQAKSSGFLFLKSAWMRSMCQPPEGYAIGAIDYSSQEFLLGAVCSGDSRMIEAYADGDVYLYYGKGIGLIPKDGTKATHGKERDLCKSTVLGLSYLMTKVGLAKKLTADTGKIVTEVNAHQLVTKYDLLFSGFSSWRNSVPLWSCFWAIRI